MTGEPKPLHGEEPDPLAGQTLSDRYRIDALVARGGMARVYRARDERLDRDVAVKVLSAPYAEDPAFTARFLEEARAAASISHPSLVHVYDSGTDGAAHFIVMELLDRHRTLRQVLDERGPLPRDEVLRIGQELLAGLRAVHDRGLVHCDVKSSNVMLGPGPAKLIDFGIARSPHDGLEGDSSIGSLHYMAPEQLHGEGLTASSDLFSLAVVLYEALTGRLPYGGATPAEVSDAHAAGRVRPPSTLVHGVPGRLDEAILQALRRESGSRFHSAEAMSRALEAASTEQRAARDDETQVVRSRPRSQAERDAPRSSGYRPPPPSAPVPERPDAARRRRPVPTSGRRRSASGIWSLLGTLLVLGAAAMVVVFVVLPLLDIGRNGTGADPTPTPPSAATPGPNFVTVPDTIGLSTPEAIEIATEAGLSWTVRCAEDQTRPEGIVEQEPPPGTEVPPGSAFTMFSARISDCR